MAQAPAQDPVSALAPGPAKGALRRVVLYSHDTLGFGHLRRNLMLAQRLKAMSPVPEVLLVAGTSEAGAFDLPAGVDLITLPAYAKQSCGTYRARRLSMALAELRDLRAGIIKAAVKNFRPDLFIADNAPLGRSEAHTSELQSLRRTSYAVFCLKKKKKAATTRTAVTQHNQRTLRNNENKN